MNKPLKITGVLFLFVCTVTLLYGLVLPEKKYVYYFVHGKWDKVVSMIDKGADVNTQDSYGQTALHYACYDAPLEVIQKLILKGADCNIKDQEGYPPITVAAYKIRWDVVSYFLESTKNIDRSVCEEVLMYAVAYGQIDIASDIISRGVSLNFYSSEGLTPLHIALSSHFLLANQKRMAKTVEFLLQNGSDVNALTKTKYDTTDSYVGFKPRTAQIHLHGFSFPEKDQYPLHMANNINLHMATNINHEKVISLLKQYGATDNSQ